MLPQSGLLVRQWIHVHTSELAALGPIPRFSSWRLLCSTVDTVHASVSLLALFALGIWTVFYKVSFLAARPSVSESPEKCKLLPLGDDILKMLRLLRSWLVSRDEFHTFCRWVLICCFISGYMFTRLSRGLAHYPRRLRQLDYSGIRLLELFLCSVPLIRQWIRVLASGF